MIKQCFITLFALICLNIHAKGRTANSQKTCAKSITLLEHIRRLPTYAEMLPIAVYVKGTQHPLTRELTTFSKFSSPEKGGTGSVPHKSFMGVSYAPGNGPLTGVIPPLKRWVQKNNGKWTPFTWQGKDGLRYEFDPVQAVYQWWTGRGDPANAKEFTMLTSMLNLVDAPRLRFLMLSGLLLGGAHAYNDYEYDQDLDEAREEYPFLDDLSQKSLADHNNPQFMAPNAIADARIADIKNAPELYKKISEDFRDVVSDHHNLAELIKDEIKNLDLPKLAMTPITDLIALKSLYEKRASLPRPTQKALEETMMIFTSPSMWRIVDTFFTDIHLYKNYGFGLNRNGKLGSLSADWDIDKSCYMSLQNPQHLQALGQVLENQIDRNIAFQIARINYDKNPDKNAAKKIRRYELASAYYSTNLKMMKVLGVYPGRTENGKWLPWNEAEEEAELKQKLDLLNTSK